MPKSPDTKARKKPTQERSKETVRAILEAASHILRTRGPDTLGTSEIARVAGVSVGSLYQYFPTKEAIIGDLIEYQLDRDYAHLESRILPMTGSYEQVARQVIGLICDYQLTLVPLLVHLLPLLHTVDRDALVLDRVDQMTDLMRRFLQDHIDELDPVLRDPSRLETALLVQTYAMRGVLNVLTLRDPSLLSTPAVREELSRNLLSLQSRQSIAAPVKIQSSKL